jgi:hypothetical protein
MGYHATVGPPRGPIMKYDVPGAIGVTEAPDRHMPVGVALRTGWDIAGQALWRLTLHGEHVPGCWVVVDRQFRPANPERVPRNRPDA